MTLRLHNYFRSSASYRVRIALHLKKLPFEYVTVHLVKDGGQQLAEGYRSKNPMAQLPTLEIPIDGTVRLVAQSMAILELLEELHPEPALLPRDKFLRARARELAELINAGIQPHQNLATRKRLDGLKEGLGTENSKHYNEVGLAAYEARVKETAGDFSVGDAPSLADVCLVPQVFSARGFDIDVDARFPTIAAIDRRCAALEGFALAHPSKQPDAA
jgi:maleylpyruvate isomerase